MIGLWGETWSSNNVYKYADEEARQRAVVKKFIQEHKNYYQCEYNDKLIVDFIELSKKPFTTETINWAYGKLLGKLEVSPNPYWASKKTFGNSVTTSLNNGNTSSLSEVTPSTEVEAKVREELDKEPEVVKPSSESGVSPLVTGRRIKNDDD